VLDGIDVSHFEVGGILACGPRGYFINTIRPLSLCITVLSTCLTKPCHLCGMSPRNFARRYTETRKRTPARAVDALRVEAARRALEENDDRINEIAERCGFTDEERMRNAFCAAAAASTLASKAAVKKTAA